MSQLPLPDKQNLTDEEFFNRTTELANLINLLNSTQSGNAPDLLLTGIRGVGKTVFLRDFSIILSFGFLFCFLF